MMQSFLLWNPSNVNDDSILTDDLSHLLNALPCDGCSVACAPKYHTGSFDDALFVSQGREHRALYDPSVICIIL